MEPNNNIIPFGKKQGKPVEVLQQDKQYLDWLQTQDWFKQKYSQFNTVIINNFNEPSETPEHNKLCNLFLEDELCKKLFYFHCKLKKINHFIVVKKPRIEYDYCLRMFNTDQYYTSGYKVFIPNLKMLSEPEPIKLIRMPTIDELKNLKLKLYRETIEKPSIHYEYITFEFWYENIKYHFKPAIFETKSIDVWFQVEDDKHSGLYDLKIEVKPCVGDDYPAILRQMQSNGANFLIADQFTATGATLEQVKEIFKRSGRNFYLFSEFI